MRWVTRSGLRSPYSASVLDELGNLTDLAILYLHDNQLTGLIPPELGNLIKLSVLKLAARPRNTVGECLGV